MAEDIKPTLTAPLDIKPVDTKTAPAPTETAKAIPAKTDAVDNKTKPATDIKVETKPETPAAELKTLLDEAGEEEGNEAEVKVVPEKYDFKLPEGMTLDMAKLSLVEPLFKELGLDNASAQKLVDLQLGIQKAEKEAHDAAWGTFIESQKKEAKDYFGTKLPEVMRNVARARDTFLSKPMQDKLNVAGFSNDKDFLETLDKIGRVIGEGKFVEGKRSAPAKGDGSVELTGPTLADVYPSMAKRS